MKYSILLVIISILFIGCNPEIFNLKTKACFEYLPSSKLKTRDTINFSNCSTNSNYYIWYFGDGDYSLEKEPKHSYRFMESYQVKLIAANRSENNIYITHDSDTIIKFINIGIGVPKANYWFKNIVGSKMAFFNVSDYSPMCLWDFGDGTVSTEENPIHTYIHNGSYNIKLKVSDGSQFDSINKTIEIVDTVDLKNTYVTDNYIDCDGDGVPDLNFKRGGFTSTSQTSKNTSITPLNDFELFTDSTTDSRTKTPSNSNKTTSSSVTIPKIYLLGDTISNTNSYTKSRLFIAYSSTDYSSIPFNSYSMNIWIKDEFRYICYRKVINKKNYIGWIKLKVLDFDKIILISFKNPCDTDKLIIDK